MTRADIVNELQGIIGPGNDANNYLTAWINDAYLYMVDAISTANPDYFTKSATTPTVATRQQYDLPSDFEKALEVNLLQNGVWSRCLALPNVTDIPIVSMTTSNQGYTFADPGYYIYGSQIGLMPIPTDNNGQIKLWYVYTVPELTTDDSIPAFPATYHHIIKYGAFADFLDRDQEFNAAEAKRQYFERRVDKMVEMMFENQDGEAKSIKITQNQDMYLDGYI